MLIYDDFIFLLRRPSVAFADYEIKDKRYGCGEASNSNFASIFICLKKAVFTSYFDNFIFIRSSVMSSLLLLCAIMEGVASFVLPIIDAFGPPKYVEHKFYFEVS